jgi:hypothetical protein
MIIIIRGWTSGCVVGTLYTLLTLHTNNGERLAPGMRTLKPVGIKYYYAINLFSRHLPGFIKTIYVSPYQFWRR